MQLLMLSLKTLGMLYLTMQYHSHLHSAPFPMHWWLCTIGSGQASSWQPVPVKCSLFDCRVIISAPERLFLFCSLPFFAALCLSSAGDGVVDNGLSSSMSPDFPSLLAAIPHYHYYNYQHWECHRWRRQEEGVIPWSLRYLPPSRLSLAMSSLAVVWRGWTHRWLWHRWGYWNPPKWVHTKCTLTKSGSTGTERKSRDESRRGTPYLLLTGPTGSYV